MNTQQFIGEIGRTCRRLRRISTAEGDGEKRWAREAALQLASCARELKTAGDEVALLRRQLSALAAELVHEQHQSHTLFMSATHAGVVSDLGGIISNANPVACELLGLSEWKLTGQPLADFVHGDDRRRFDDWMRRLRDAAADRSLCAECGGRMELQLSTSSHERSVPCEIAAVPMSGPDGSIRAVHWMISDVSERREAALARDLREENRHRDEFLAILGHELRNPLAAIALAVDVLGADGARSGEGPTARTYRMLERNARQLGRLVDDLMDVSKGARGKLALADDLVDLRDIIGAAAETVHPIVSARQHQLTVVRPRSPVLVRGDAARLAQVVTNLLDNAAKYTPVGGHLEVVLRRTADRAGIAVRDDGIGIAGPMLERVFDLFLQIPDASGPGRGRGLGLGLALVQQLVQLHGGSVRALSDGPSKGSTFIVDLPLVDGEGLAPPAVEDQHPGARAPASRLLLIDDHEDAAALLAMALRARGYQVDVAHDGCAGLERARQGDYQVALVDLGLPDIDGYEVCRQLRRDTPRLRLLALTGYGDDRARAEASRAGFDGFLLKPVPTDLVESAIQGTPARSEQAP